MASTYVDRSLSEHGAEAPRGRSLGEHVFIWVAWAAAAVFWGATLTTLVGIVRAIGQTPATAAGGADFGGVAWLIIDVVFGVVLLGAALAFASWMYARRDRRLDPAGEAATARLYDAVERQGGEDMTSRSPDLPRTDRSDPRHS
jgi:hypothetical protein